MFVFLQSEIASRLFDVRFFVSEACDSAKNPYSHVHSKGLVFVQLYAVYEYAMVNSVLAGLTAIQRAGLALNEVRSEILSLILSPEFQSVCDAGTKKRWESRIRLMKRALSQDAVPPPPSNFFPSDGSHFRRQQLHTIWSLFGMTSSVVADRRHYSTIDELVEHRNAIAHGRETSRNIGGRYSLQDIINRITDTQNICSYIVNTLRSHCETPSNLRRPV